MLIVCTTDIDKYLASPLEFWVNMKGKSKISVQSCLNVIAKERKGKNLCFWKN